MTPASYQAKLRRQLAAAETRWIAARDSIARAEGPRRYSAALERARSAGAYRNDLAARLAASEAAGACSHVATDDHTHQCPACGAVYRRAGGAR
jgi:hypothetical protein